MNILIPPAGRMQKLAKELGVAIPVTFFEEANNAHYNSIAIIDADGTDLGLYRKSHIPDGPGFQEKFYFNPGDTGFKAELWLSEILFYPTATGSEPQDVGLDSCDHWRRVMQGHAGANVVIFKFWLERPTGKIVASTDDKEEAVLVAQFDLDKIKSKRYIWGVFRDWRPDLYKHKPKETSIKHSDTAHVKCSVWSRTGY
ncbi:nitrilase-like protein 1 [Actinidia rufa]|uniref:Nitrilase-like protein 1 n=1 Tax=Actinidia rufa TaxID=165716 RepID=A0A7J0H3U7_9ERIC|nr:nitrilase-like protein 1 [Actinidia rufa]